MLVEMKKRVQNDEMSGARLPRPICTALHYASRRGGVGEGGLVAEKMTGERGGTWHKEG